MELETLKKMDHPNIVTIYEFYEEEFYFHIVSDYVEGGSLIDYLGDCNSLSENMIARYMAQILSALSYSHALNVFHTDLKPDSLLLDRKALDGNLKLLDFGISKLMQQITVSKELLRVS